MKVGFTGTQKGMTARQRVAVAILMVTLCAEEGHHVDCVGADEEFHNIITMLKNIKRIIHPPIRATARAYCEGDFSHEKNGYLERNKTIVDSTELLIGASLSSSETLRSGTWSTIRYARKKAGMIIVIFPDGSIKCENIDPLIVTVLELAVSTAITKSGA